MKEYRKIPNCFKFDEKYKKIVDLNEPFKSLSELTWIGTEKVDGTNIRIHWDGHKIEIGGRTDKAQFQDDLKTYLDSIFLTEEMEYIFEQVFGEKDAMIFGEGYGPKIQNGGTYSDTPKFIVFDIDINGYHLNRTKVNEVSEKLGLDSVPIVFSGDIYDAIKFIGSNPNSKINAKHEMEGLVLELEDLDIYDSKGERIKCKCKYRDIRSIIKNVYERKRK